MDKVLYDSLCRYFTTLARVGNVSYASVDKLLVLMFYKHFIYEDYRGNLSKEDYNTIEQALDYLFGSTCLIPYPNYLEMGKLHLGDMTEMAHRITDNESHTQEVDNRLKYTEVITEDNVRRLVNAETRFDKVESRTSVVEGRLDSYRGSGMSFESFGQATEGRLNHVEGRTTVIENRLDKFNGSNISLEEWGNMTNKRLTVIESTKVLKNTQEVLEVPDIVF